MRAVSGSPSPPRAAPVSDRRGSRDYGVKTTGSGGHEPIWPSEWSRVGAVALIGSDRVATVAGRMVPRGATVGALAIAWSRQTGELEDVLRRVGGMTESEPVESLIRTVSRLTDARRILDGILAELQAALELAVRDVSPRRVDVGAILGVRRRASSGDEEKAPPGDVTVRRVRSRSSSFGDDRRRHY